MTNSTKLFAFFLMMSSTNVIALPIDYTYRSDFLDSVGTTITDTYDNPEYLDGDVWKLSYLGVHSDTSMNNVFGETNYQSTGVANHNSVTSWLGETAYCAGCNVSFLMSFLDTSISSSGGVYGVGFDTLGITWSGTKAVYAYVEFSDFSYQSYWLDEFSFWGITSDLGIRSIHIGLEDGSPTLNASIGIDNLTIATAVPEPKTYILLIFGLLIYWLFRLSRVVKTKTHNKALHRNFATLRFAKSCELGRYNKRIKGIKGDVAIIY